MSTSMASDERLNNEIQVGILTISDTYYNDSQGGNQGKGKHLRKIIEGDKLLYGRVAYEELVPDDRNMISNTLKNWCDVRKLELILTSGGTGFTERDVTPEATKDVIEKEAPGMAIAMMNGSLLITPLAMLSRLVCGIRGSTLIINLPGSPKGSEECLRIVSSSIPHAIDLLRGCRPQVSKVHRELQEEGVRQISYPPGNRNTHDYQHHVPQLDHNNHHHHHHHGDRGNHHQHGDRGSHHQHGDRGSHHQHGERGGHHSPHHSHSPDHHHRNHSQENCHSSGKQGHQHGHHHHKNHGDKRQSHGDSPSSSVDAASVAYRARESPYPIVSVADALKVVLEQSHTMKPESMSITEAQGRYLAEDIFAKDALPPFPASIKDGYAVVAADGDGIRTVIGGSTAGDMPKSRVSPGLCMRINTGAPLPPGADAVIQVEDTVLTKHSEDGKIELEIKLMTIPQLDQDIRKVGSDISQGSQILSKGQRLGPAELGLLATVGVTLVSCYALPVVGVMSTGDELVEPGQELKEGQIRDSNRTTLLSQLKDFGVNPRDLGIAPDTPDGLLQFMKKSLEVADVIITTGGVSMGEKDFVKQVLEKDFKATIHFARVFMKPGKPTTFATLQHCGKKKLFFSLPGNPVSALVTCNLYVIPSYHKMIGSPNPKRTVIKARISQDVRLDPRPEYHRAVLSWEDGEQLPLAVSTGNQISSRLLSLSSANSLLMLPPKSDSQAVINKGEIVDAMVIGRI